MVVIVGAGLGGLFLGILLERARIPYRILERAIEVKPLGAGVTLNVNIMPAFEQLGLLDDLLKIGMPVYDVNLFNEKMQKIGTVSGMNRRAIDGYDTHLFTRKKLYDLLLKHVPEHKISFGKRVVNIEERDSKVFIQCADGSIHAADILVGADGAYSTVRQALYKGLDQRGLLPKSDLKKLAAGYINIIGTAQPIAKGDPTAMLNKYPQLKEDTVQFSSVIGQKQLSWGVASAKDNEVTWGIAYQLSEKEAGDQLKSSEWNPESSSDMLRGFYDLPCPWGGTMGEIIEATPKEMRSRVVLEEKVFETWHHGRVVLIGDGAGLGAVNALQDAVVLSNCLYDLPNINAESIKAAFQEYYEQRYSHAVKAFKLSNMVSGVMNGT
ncbi:hypothetical protein BX616_006649, partial [Lobosporangium transversale]